VCVCVCVIWFYDPILGNHYGPGVSYIGESLRSREPRGQAFTIQNRRRTSTTYLPRDVLGPQHPLSLVIKLDFRHPRKKGKNITKSPLLNVLPTRSSMTSGVVLPIGKFLKKWCVSRHSSPGTPSTRPHLIRMTVTTLAIQCFVWRVSLGFWATPTAITKV